MLVFTIGILIAAYTTWKIASTTWGDWNDWIVGSFMGLLVGLLFIITVGLGLGAILPKTIEYTNNDLVAIQDGSDSTGGFFLGSGVIDSQAKYTYYIKDGEARLLESTDAQDVRVFEGGDRAYVRKESGCKSSYEWIAPCLISGGVTEIHVPTGTIKQDFVLDAQ